MTKASIETLLVQLNSSKIKTSKARVYRYIRRNPYCTKDDIIRDLNMPHQTTTARLSDLLDLGVIEAIGSVGKVTGMVSMLMVQKDKEKIKKNADSRRMEKYQRWLKAGEQFNDLISA